MPKKASKILVPCDAFDVDEPCPLTFGMPVPCSSPVAWGFRGIQDRSGFSLVWDRQSWRPAPDKSFSALLNAKIIPFLQKAAKELSGDRNDVLYFAGDHLRATISTRSSFGYVYGSIWKVA